MIRKATIWKVKLTGNDERLHIMTPGSSFYDMNGIENLLKEAADEFGVSRDVEIESIEKYCVAMGTTRLPDEGTISLREDGSVVVKDEAKLARMAGLPDGPDTNAAPASASWAALAGLEPLDNNAKPFNRNDKKWEPLAGIPADTLNRILDQEMKSGNLTPEGVQRVGESIDKMRKDILDRQDQKGNVELIDENTRKLAKDQKEADQNPAFGIESDRRAHARKRRQG